MNYEEDIRIDETSLDVEWLDQPELMMKYCRIQADMAKKEELARENLDLVRAELDKEIRSDPERFEIGKVTEGSILSAILSHTKYKAASQKLIDARYENTISKGAVRSIEHRKEALENMVKLHGQSYFAGPKMPRDIHWEREQKQKEINKLVKESSNGKEERHVTKRTIRNID